MECELEAGGMLTILTHLWQPGDGTAQWTHKNQNGANKNAFSANILVNEVYILNIGARQIKIELQYDEKRNQCGPLQC